MAQGDKKGTFFGNLLRGISGGIPGLLTSAAGSIISNIGAKRRQQTADDKNIEFWKMQNQYNTPAAQMQRLKDAGLNPNLIYGSSPAGASGSAGSIAPSKAAPYAIKDPTQSIAQMQLLEAQKDNLNANTFKTNESGFLTKEQKFQLKNMRDSNIEIARYKADQELQKSRQELYNTLELKNSFQKRVEILSELVKQNKSQTALKELDKKFAKESQLRPTDPFWARSLKNLWDLLTDNKPAQWYTKNHHSPEKANEIKRKYKEKFNKE